VIIAPHWPIWFNQHEATKKSAPCPCHPIAVTLPLLPTVTDRADCHNWLAARPRSPLNIHSVWPRFVVIVRV